MLRPTHRQKTPARPLLSEADYAMRGRRETERRALEHRLAKDAREARGEVRIQTCVPAVHEDLIHGLVRDICEALNQGRLPEDILSWRRAATATSTSDRPCDPAAASSARDNPARSGPTGQDEDADADDPAAWRGQDLKARRAAQRRRWAARKKADGLKRIGLVVPEVFRATILDILAQIVTRLEEGLLPVVEVTGSGSSEAVASRHEETRTRASVAPSACVTISPAPGVPDTQDAAHGKAPGRQAGEDPESRVASLGYPRELPYGSVLPRIEPRWREARRPADQSEEHSALFDDVHNALSWLERSRSRSSGTEDGSGNAGTAAREYSSRERPGFHRVAR